MKHIKLFEEMNIDNVKKYPYLFNMFVDPRHIKEENYKIANALLKKSDEDIKTPILKYDGDIGYYEGIEGYIVVDLNSDKIKDKSNYIIEERPIKVNVEKSWTKTYYTIEVEPMLMKRDTADKLSSGNIRLSEIDWECRKKKSLDIKKDNFDHKYQNDVKLFSYNHHDGKAMFSANILDDVKNWLAKYSDIVYTDQDLDSI